MRVDVDAGTPTSFVSACSTSLSSFDPFPPFSLHTISTSALTFFHSLILLILLTHPTPLHSAVGGVEKGPLTKLDGHAFSTPALFASSRNVCPFAPL